MSKTIKNKFDKHLTFIKLLEAHERASLGKKNRKEIILFEMDLETNIMHILNDIKNMRYKIGTYRKFIIYEPKERVIQSLPYRDRVVHQWYVEEFIKPFFFPKFIQNTYACIDKRGTHKAVLDLQKFMRKMKKNYDKYYVLKCDVKKYFYTIDRQILFNILIKNISDKKLLKFTALLLDDLSEKGIPIGNYTSQFFANIYLNELDHYVKEQLRIKYYIRYMDDFILLVESKKDAQILKNKISQFLRENLKLELNQKSRYFPNTAGIDFCGYRIYETHILLRKRFKRKIKKSILFWNHLEKKNCLNRKRKEQSWNSYLAHASHANSYFFINKMKRLKENVE